MKLQNKLILIGITLGLLAFPIAAFAEDSNSNQPETAASSGQSSENNSQMGKQDSNDNKDEMGDKASPDSDTQTSDKSDNKTEPGDKASTDSNTKSEDVSGNQWGETGNVEDKSGDSQSGDGANNQSE